MDPATTVLLLASAYDKLRDVASKINEDAPKISKAAHRLWRKVSKKRSSESSTEEGGESGGSVAVGVPVDDINGRVAVVELQDDVRESLEITSALAEQCVRFSDFAESTRNSFEAINHESQRLVTRLESTELVIKALEKQNGLLFSRIESDGVLLARLEANNVQLAREVEAERLHVGRLSGALVAIGLLAATGLIFSVVMLLR